MRRLSLLVIASCLAGCPAPSSPDPRATLAPGDEVLIVDQDEPEADVPFDTTGGGFTSVPPATKGRVVSDPGDSAPNRRVIVTILEGPKEGETGKFTRSLLKPVR